MTKLITVVIIVAALFGLWELWAWYDRVEHDKEDEASKAKVALVVGDNLPGMPWQIDQNYQNAKAKGAEGLKTFLATYGARVEDPRKAWIELDYCVLIAREHPAEAKRIFADVKARTPTTSRIWKRIEELSKSYE